MIKRYMILTSVLIVFALYIGHLSYELGQWVARYEESMKRLGAYDDLP